MSEEHKSSDNRRSKSSKRGNRNKNRSGRGGASRSEHKSGPKQSSNKRRRGNRNRRRSSGPRLNGFEKIERSYTNLLEAHMIARRKYFEMYHRADPRQLEKLEKRFNNTLAELRNFEKDIDSEHREEFNKRYNGLDPDLTYSNNHNLSPKAAEVPLEGEFADPHYLNSQAKADYSQDTEESSGSIEDYQRYKGLV